MELKKFVWDYRYKILYVDFGAYGHQSDLGIYDKSSFKQHLEKVLLNIPGLKKLLNFKIEIEHFFVGDGAFSPSVNLMKPLTATTFLKQIKFIITGKLD